MGKDQTYDHLLKFLVVGNSGVGKTNMILRFCENNFLSSHMATIGIDFKTKTIMMDAKKIRMQIWDTAGQQRFKTITQTYYRGAMGIFLVYSIDDKQSFYEIQNWIKQIKTHAPHNVVRVLIGNKADSPNRQINKSEGQQLAKQHNISFFETSAKTGDNIDNCFMAMAKQVKSTFIEQNSSLKLLDYKGTKLTKDKTTKQKDSKKTKQCCQ